MKLTVDLETKLHYAPEFVELLLYHGVRGESSRDTSGSHTTRSLLYGEREGKSDVNFRALNAYY
jgi:hypothetical protein